MLKPFLNSTNVTVSDGPLLIGRTRFLRSNGGYSSVQNCYPKHLVVAQQVFQLRRTRMADIALAKFAMTRPCSSLMQARSHAGCGGPSI
jgi:hypothetical protein